MQLMGTLNFTGRYFFMADWCILYMYFGKLHSSVGGTEDKRVYLRFVSFLE